MPARGSGHLDACNQAYCAGWAVWDAAPATLGIWLNGERIDTVRCVTPRADLAALGLPHEAGFTYYYPETLTLEDRLEVRFPDGSGLRNANGAQPPGTQHRERLGRMLTGIDPARPGLEFGPLSRPLLSRQRSGIRYVDYLSRAELLEKYRAPGMAERMRPDRIPEIDHVWRGERLRDVVGEGWCHCLASHMIEHAPDPIGYLAQFAEVLVPGGRINLAIPNRPDTFDHARAPSRPADMLDAWARGLRRPSFGQIFDHLATAYAPGRPPADRPALARAAFAAARHAEAEGSYVDVHCHVWSFESFQECWAVLETVGVLPLRLAQAFPPSGAEFIVSLVKT